MKEGPAWPGPLAFRRTLEEGVHGGNMVSPRALAVELLYDDAGVVAAEAERVGDPDPDRSLARLVGDVVEVALGIRVVVVDRRRQRVAVDREHREDRLDRARGAQAVAGGALRGGHGRLTRVLLAERELDHTRLARVSERRRRSVGVDVVDLV